MKIPNQPACPDSIVTSQKKWLRTVNQPTSSGGGRSSSTIGIVATLAGALLLVSAFESHASGSASDDQTCQASLGTVEYRSCSASKVWCGFDTYITTIPKRKYLVQTTTERAAPYSSSGSSSCDLYMGRSMSCRGTLSY